MPFLQFFKNIFSKRKSLDQTQFERIINQIGLSETDIHKLRRKFDEHKMRSSNPFLTKEEFISFYSELRPELKDQTDVSTRVFKLFDQDNSGTLTFQEFLTGYILTSKGFVILFRIFSFIYYCEAYH